jgi:hypothetical protein
VTEAGKKWALKFMRDTSNPANYGSTGEQADFWLRAFCDEIEKRAGTKSEPPRRAQIS